MRNFCLEDFFLFGVVSGVGGPVSGVSISYTVDGTAATTLTDSNGEYCIRVPRCASVVVSAKPMLGVTATPERYAFNPVCSDLLSLNFALAPVTPETVTITGAVSDALGPVGGVTINYTTNGTILSTTTNADGSYHLTAPVNSNVVITPVAPSGTMATPSSINLTGVSGDVSGQNFLLTNIVNLVTVSGTVSGLPDNSNLAISYAYTGGMFGTAFTDATGFYSFTVPSGSTNLTIVPPAVGGLLPTPEGYAIGVVTTGTSGKSFVY